MRHILILAVLITFFSSCKYYLKGHRVSKEDYKFCKQLNKDSLHFYDSEPDNKFEIVYVLCGMDTIYTEPTGPYIELRIEPWMCTCKEFLEIKK